MSIFRWTDELIFELIDLYRDNPVLWCTKHVNYRNKRIKDLLYQSISQKLNVGVDELKKKFCNLRTQFAKEQAKVMASCSSAASPAEVYVPGWHFYKKLTFLRDGSEYRESYANIEAVYNSLPDATFEDEVKQEDIDSESNSSLVEQSQNGISQAFSRRVKRKNDEADTTSASAPKTLRVISANTSVKQNMQHQIDTNETFGLFVAKYLDLIEDYNLQSETRFRIHELLFKATERDV